jgi:Multiubiquitin
MREDNAGAVVDVEEHAREGRPLPHAAEYRIRIDRERYEVCAPTISGRELLQLAGKVPIERFAVYLKRVNGATERIGVDQRVDLRGPGVERFVTLPLDQTEG